MLCEVELKIIQSPTVHFTFLSFCIKGTKTIVNLFHFESTRSEKPSSDPEEEAANITVFEEVYAIRGLDAGALEERIRT